MNEKRENELAEYISRYIYKLNEVPESLKHKYFRYAVIGTAVFIGGFAGVPWIETGLKLGAEVQAWLGYAAAVSVVIAYGVTSIWAFLELTDFLKPEPEEIQALISNEHYYLKISDHLFCHLTGILATLPTVYISYKFNTHLIYVILASFISYSFNTVGLYQLKKIISTSLKRHNVSSGELEVLEIRNLFNLCITNLQDYHLKTFKASIAELNTSSPDSINTEIENKHFIRALQNIEIREPLSQDICIKTVSKIIFSLIPVINALVTGLICYEAILALNLNLSSIGFIFITMLTLLLVVTPLFGVDLYAMGKLSEHFAESLSSLMHGKLMVNCSKEKLIIVVVALILSGFSALTDAYVAKTSADASVFKPISLFFACIMWLTKTSLETIAVSTIFMRSLEFRQQTLNPSPNHDSKISNRLSNLKLLFFQTKPDILLDYQNQYRLENKSFKSENTELNKSPSWKPQFFEQVARRGGKNEEVEQDEDSLEVI